MDILRLTSPWLLLIALPAWAIILLAVLGPLRRRGSWRFTRCLARAILPLLATGLLVAALAGPSLRVSRQGVCPIVIAEDVSASMAVGRGPAGPGDALSRAAAAMPPREAGLVQFAGSARLLAAPRSPEAAALRRADAFPPPDFRAADPQTDIEAGLAEAARALPDGQGLILLYTDARETHGLAAPAAMRLAARGIHVYALAPDLHPRDVRVVSIAPAAPPQAGRPVLIQVRLASTYATTAAVRLTRRAAGAAPAATLHSDVAVGPAAPAAVLFTDAALPPGDYVYEAELSAPDDAVAANNRARLALRVGSPHNILYLHATPSPGPPAARIAKNLPAGWQILTASTAAAPAIAGPAPAVLIVDNVSARTLGREAALHLIRQVTDGGAGLLVLGGDAGFAAGGYADSPLEAALPVSSRTAERPPLDLVLVIDSSGSMNEHVGELQKLALAKQAVLALHGALGGADRIGLVTFAAQPRVAMPLSGLAAWEDLRARLLATEAGGGTRITPAVESALALFPPPAANNKTVRHIALLTDGLSEDFDTASLIALCRRDSVSLSTVATGPDADRERLDRLAADTGGKAYTTGDLGRLAETFLKDLAWARGDAPRDMPRPTLMRRPEPIWTAPEAALPPVGLFNATRAKDGADVLWIAEPAPAKSAMKDAPANVPLLAVWRRGAGKVAAMPWAVSAAPAAWNEGDLLGRRLADIVAWLASEPVPQDWSARLVERDGRWWVRVEERPEAIGKSAAYVAASLGIADGGSAAAPARLIEVAPGIYEAEVAAQAAASAAIIAVHRDFGGAAADGGVVNLSLPDVGPQEFQNLGVDLARLEEIVRAGGGRILDTPEAVAAIAQQTEIQGYAAIGIHLVWAAGVLVILAVGLRMAGRL